MTTSKYILALFFLILITPITRADQDVTLKDLVDSNNNAEQEQASLSKAKPLSTPLGATLQIREAGRALDWQRLASYADFRYLPAETLAIGEEELVRKLALIWQQYQILDVTNVSDDERGNLNDGLPRNRELAAILQYEALNFPLYLDRIKNSEGEWVWLISNATIAQIPNVWEEYGYPYELEQLERWLPEFSLFYMHNWQVVALLMLVGIAWFISGLIKWALLLAVARITFYNVTMQSLIRKPLRRFFLFLILHLGVYKLGLPLKARVILDTGILAYLAGMFLALGMVEFCRAVYVARAMAKDDNYVPGFVSPLVTIVKCLVITIVFLLWLESAGYNMATILTGLGIGSLAIALAAQKTLENVFGAITLFVARPIKPGDFCRFGDTVGTVEEIGLRSTSIRKLDQTLVNVPNSVFSAQALENYSKINNRLYRQQFILEPTMSSDSLQELLLDMNNTLQDHPDTLDKGCRVKFERINQQGFVLQANAYLNTNDFEKFLQTSEKLNLLLLSTIEMKQGKIAHSYVAVQTS